MRPSVKVVARLGAVLALSACSVLQAPSAQAPALYLLDAPPVAARQAPASELVLAVSPPRAWPGFDTPRMAYQQQPQQLNYFVDNRWTDTPSRMLAPVLARALSADGRFNAVVSIPTPVSADLRLDTEIVRLQQDFTVQPSRIQLTLRAQLVDLRSRRVLATREFNEFEPATSGDAAGGARAANLALARLLQQLADFCAKEPARR